MYIYTRCFRTISILVIQIECPSIHVSHTGMYGTVNKMVAIPYLCKLRLPVYMF